MSTISVSTVVAVDVTAGTLRSTNANPPQILNNAGTEIGTFCRAWVNFQGSGANGNQTIRASFNVSSVNRTAATTYVVNFATPITDANYSIQQMCARDGITSTVNANLEGAPSTTNFTVVTRTGGASAADPTYVMLSIFR